MVAGSGQGNAAIRIVALFEALKGLLVLAAACGLLSLLHRDIHAIALHLVEHAHLNPAAKYPHIFLDAANDLHDGRLRLLALGAAVYSGVRFAEAWGLLRERAWAELLAAGSGALYLPFEGIGFIREPGLLHAALLVVNLAVVVIMLRALRQRRLVARAAAHASDPNPPAGT